mmetsp:Transcript_49/g.57  ORF Transcript_49/g.57 Transcript_49/m.57 type:complete len:201 (-) Transcript_49:4-606(-)
MYVHFQVVGPFHRSSLSLFFLERCVAVQRYFNALINGMVKLNRFRMNIHAPISMRVSHLLLEFQRGSIRVGHQCFSFFHCQSTMGTCFAIDSIGRVTNNGMSKGSTVYIQLMGSSRKTQQLHSSNRQSVQLFSRQNLVFRDTPLGFLQVLSSNIFIWSQTTLDNGALCIVRTDTDKGRIHQTSHEGHINLARILCNMAHE